MCLVFIVKWGYFYWFVVFGVFGLIQFVEDLLVRFSHLCNAARTIVAKCISVFYDLIICISLFWELGYVSVEWQEGLSRG